ncbi:hypothetical protein [Aminobacter aminovorans]|nr:hypothetical protein [Aminobacter aminovorans]
MNNEFMQTPAFASLLILADPLLFADARTKIATSRASPVIACSKVSVNAELSKPSMGMPASPPPIGMVATGILIVRACIRCFGFNMFMISGVKQLAC